MLSTLGQAPVPSVVSSSTPDRPPVSWRWKTRRRLTTSPVASKFPPRSPPSTLETVCELERRPRQQPQIDRRDVSTGRALRRHWGQRRRQEHACQRHSLPGTAQRSSGQPTPSAPHDALIQNGDVAQVVFLDQSPLVRSARSNPATHLKAFDEIRRTFAATHEAKVRNYDAGRFSFNVEGGRCNQCQGNGFLTIDMQFLPDVLVRCPECQGTRYRPEVLEVTYRGKNISEVLDLTAREALAFFRNRPKVQSRLRSMLEIGLDYLRLGQPLRTLSGGEAQRLKLASFLARSLVALKRPGAPPHTIFLLDEPAAGLHPIDVVKLIEALGSLVERGHSVIVIENSPEVMAAADWIIDLGPGGGELGGRLLAEGTPEDVAQSASPTGQVLARTLRAGPRPATP